MKLHKERKSFVFLRSIQILVTVFTLLLHHNLKNNVVLGVDNQNPNYFNIGAVLEMGPNIVNFLTAIANIQSEKILPDFITVNGCTVYMMPNPIRIAQCVCDELISKQVYAVVIGSPVSEELSPASVSYTCGFYNIPVIGISSRDSSLSDKNLHASFLRTVPPYSHQADVWIELLKFFKYNCVIFLHSSDNDGRATLGRFQTLADNANIKIESVIEYEPGITDITQELEEKKELFCRVFILYANTKDADGIFREVDRLNMTSSGYVWLVSEQALSAPTKLDGILGIQLVNGSDEEAHIFDSVYIIGLALKALYHKENITEPPSNCDSKDKNWETGEKFVQYLKNQKLSYGKTGHVMFDDKGDRLNSNYKIINIVDRQFLTVGQFAYSQAKEKMDLQLNSNIIVWPGNLTVKPLGYIVPTHLKVVTIEEKPFVWTRPIPYEGECGENEILCPKHNTTNGETQYYCCRGYCMDLLNALSNSLNFTFDLYQVEDTQYGSFDYVNGSQKKMWTGMVGDLYYERADMVVAPLTINPERSEVIEFSKPFKYQGITILEKKQPKSSTLASFLQPFQKTLWILVMVSVHVVALALYLLDRFSPFGRYKLPNNDATEEDALNLSSAIWFAWGVLLNSGIGEGTPRSFSARVLGMVWAGFAMIVVASYTANLAAFLVLDRPETSLTGINDARLRNPMENFIYATVKGSSVDMYFRRQVELSNMYRTMEGKNYETVEEAITAIKSGELNAFIWDSSRLEYEAAQDCDLVTAGEQFGRSGYGIGLKKSSFWAEHVTLALLSMHESGDMEDLDNKWILQGGDKCDNKNEKFPATLGLKNMAGVFILVGAGIVGGIGLIIIEIIYKKHQTRKQRRMEAARNCADKWRGTVEKRKTLRATLLNQKRPKSNGMEAFTVERGMRGLMTMTSTTTTTITTTVSNVDPPPPPPPPRTVPPSGILPSILTVDIPPNEPDPDIHNIPPPPPPPSSSPAIRLRGRRVVYASRNHPEYSAHDATV
ncbi:glutamate [NMDA] receptor subunit 1-like isoform X1 [Centruroides vittatus]|uniref:glutamate [NMDA] receptor subunit 1-like isoform X1 n=1 Tax=Centruroides vittatus TaxID=120091 RepID=UPI0035105F1B